MPFELLPGMKSVSGFAEFLYQYETVVIRLSRLLLATIAVVSFSACSEYLNGKPFRSNFIEIKSDGKLACLDDIAGDMQKFFDSTGSTAEVDKTVSCINTTLTELQIRVEGRAEATAFTAEEVYEILAKFASSANVSKLAAQNLVLLKAALLGGETGKITKAEINLLKNYLLIVRDEAKKLQPYIRLFYFKSSERAYSKGFIKEGFDQLNQSLKNLYRHSNLTTASYSFESFKELVINLLNLTEDKVAMAEMANRLNTVLNGNLTVLTEAERLAYIDNITEALRLYAVFANGYAKFEIVTSAGLNETFDFFDQGFRLLENSLQYKKNQSISGASIDGLVSAVTKSKFLPYKLSAYTLAIFYRTIVVRVFEAGAKGNISGFSALKAFHIKNIKSELATYRVYSKLLERVASEELFARQGITNAPLREIQLAIGALSAAAETEILSQFDTGTQAKIINNVNDLKSEFLESVPVIYHGKKLGIAINQDLWGQNWHDLARGLYIKMLTRLLMQGWGQIYPLENIGTNFLTETDMATWYAEFKYFGIETKMFDPRTFNSGPTAYKTGNLFTRSANGDSRLSFKETLETLGILMTGGGVLHKEISDGLSAAGCNLPELDIFDNHWNFENCYLQVVQSNYKKYFSSLPHMVAYLDTLNADQVKFYFESVVNVVRTDEANTGTKVETTDIQSMNSLVHFIEGLFLIHDLNQNRSLSEAEIRAAYPKFLNIATEFANKASRAQIEEFKSWKGDLAGYSCFTEQDLVRESFVFLIYNGRTPNQEDFNSFPCFRGTPLLYFTGEVDRKAMLNTFKALKSVLGN